MQQQEQNTHIVIQIFQEFGKAVKEASPYAPYAGIIAFAFVFSKMMDPSEVSARDMKNQKRMDFLFNLRIVFMSCLCILFVIAFISQIRN